MISIVFVIIAALWGQVEYRIRQLAPWRAMAKGPAPAADSLLLDYVSPFSIVCFFTSMKKSQYAVALVILSSFMIKLATIFSTGLFILEDVLIEDQDASLHIINRFDGSRYNDSLVDARPILTVIGMQKYNLRYPDGTTNGYALQGFNISSPITGKMIFLLSHSR